MEQPVLKVDHLSVRFGDGCEHCLAQGDLNRNICPKCGTVWANRDVSFEVYPGEILGIVGESGSGKSTVLRCLYFDQEAANGDVRLDSYYEGQRNLLKEDRQSRRWIRNHKLGMVYQNPLMGLRMKISSSGNIAEKLLAAEYRNYAQIRERVDVLFEAVRMPKSRLIEAPRNFSGGMQQRVQISKALANNPSVLFLDEVTTGLDLSVQAHVLELIRAIRREFGVSMILVSHDLSVIRMLADRTLVMHDGQVIERGLTDQILDDPQQSYTQELVQSML